ncbi:MAG: NADP-dependent oxidoreductase [Candidatus Sericytochromatia bacterium]
MKAYLVDAYHKNQPLRLGDAPEPEVQPEDILIEVQAFSLNPLDAKLRDGEFKLLLPYRPPFILGHDVAGVVVRVGAEVTRFQPGDEVYARPRDGRIGTFAEYIAVHQADAALKPRKLSMAEAAAIPLVGLTAWQALVEKARLTKGQKVLIHAGSGGVGSVAIQLAKHLGATVATTAGPANLEWVKNLGADVVINYREQDFAKELSGYDVVLHSLDQVTLEKSLSVLKPGGKLISLSGPPDPAFAQSKHLNPLMQLVIRGLSRRTRKKAQALGVEYSFLFMRANGQQLETLTQLIEAGVIRPVIDTVFPFGSTPEAMRYLETGRAKGKIVIDRSKL